MANKKLLGYATSELRLPAEGVAGELSIIVSGDGRVWLARFCFSVEVNHEEYLHMTGHTLLCGEYYVPCRRPGK